MGEVFLFGDALRGRRELLRLDERGGVEQGGRGKRWRRICYFLCGSSQTLNRTIVVSLYLEVDITCNN